MHNWCLLHNLLLVDVVGPPSAEVSLHHNTTSATVRFVGKTTSHDRQSVGKNYCRPILFVGESPDGKSLSRPTYLCRPIACWLWGTFPDRHSVGPAMVLSRPTVYWACHEAFPTNCLTEFVFPTNSLLGLLGGFPDRLCDRVCFPDQLFVGPCISFLRQTMRWFFRFAHKHPIALNSLHLRYQQNINQVSCFITITCMP